MADINLGDDVVRLPRWTTAVVVGAILAAGGSAIKTWADTTTNSTDISRQEIHLNHSDERITKLEEKLADLTSKMAAVNQNVKDMKEVQDTNSGKLDRILELEMSHSRK